jgi:hypothetical protein
MRYWQQTTWVWHCADLDYKIFSILPPFNVVYAQVIRLGKAGQLPLLREGTDMDVFYSATSSPNDPGRTLPERTGRRPECKEKDIPGCNETGQGKRIQLSRGTQASCALCHDNFIDKDQGSSD